MGNEDRDKISYEFGCFLGQNTLSSQYCDTGIYITTRHIPVNNAVLKYSSIRTRSVRYLIVIATRTTIMSKNAWQQADDKDSSVDVPANVPSGDVQDDSYATSGPKEPVPVQGDDAPVEDPIDAKTADSDEQLGKYAS